MRGAYDQLGPETSSGAAREGPDEAGHGGGPGNGRVELNGVESHTRAATGAGAYRSPGNNMHMIPYGNHVGATGE